jgi:serine protease Do/serine protease DegQ
LRPEARFFTIVARIPTGSISNNNVEEIMFLLARFQAFCYPLWSIGAAGFISNFSVTEIRNRPFRFNPCKGFSGVEFRDSRPRRGRRRCFSHPLWLVVLIGSVLGSSVDAAIPVGNNPLPNMLEQVMPAVVNISTKTRIRYEENPLLRDPFFRHFFDIPSIPREREQQSLGSGVIIDADKGYIITNYHVIGKADQITVTLYDRRNFDASVVGSDPDTDIALIKIKAPDLIALPKGNSDVLRVGDLVVAIGNPFGLGQTVTSGIVSALGRSSLGIEGYEDFIQTDASINPGNSGGALVDTNGYLIGINTAIIGPSGGNIGIGFAIPINMATQIMDQILRYGTIQRGQLGVQVQDLTPDLARSFDISIDRGAIIADVVEGSPAHKAGLLRGDVVTAVNGNPVDSAAKLRNVIGLARVGDTVTLNIIRKGDERRVRARIEARKTNPLQPY